MVYADPRTEAPVKVATWNVNSIRVRVDAVAEWLKRHEPDVLCMQETKVVDDDFPTEEFQRLGYAVAMAGEPAYNGVAIASRLPMKDVVVGLDGDGPGAAKRLIAATIGNIRVVSAYVPNGKSVRSPAFAEKLAWLERLRLTLDARLSPAGFLLLSGDFNIAADERDVYDPEAFRGKVHFHPDEHEALAKLVDFGLVDSFRLFNEKAGQYSWWDYRAGGFERNQGLRIDYIFVTRAMIARCRSVWMDVEPRNFDKPSDHIPVVAELTSSTS